MDVIHEDVDFECDTSMDGKHVQVFQCGCDVVFVELRSLIRRAAACGTEDTC